MRGDIKSYDDHLQKVAFLFSIILETWKEIKIMKWNFRFIENERNVFELLSSFHSSFRQNDPKQYAYSI